MTSFARAKSVTAPLDERARARLIGGGLVSYASSGSEHSAADGDFTGEESSLCLSELVHRFIEDNGGSAGAGYDSDPDRGDSSSGAGDCAAGYVEDIRRSTANEVSDPYRNILLSHVTKAMELFSYLSDQRPLLRRKVMTYLREIGHNAGVCKTRWGSSASGSLTAGSHEFIDVVLGSSSPQRYVVDLDFADQFEIARPTVHYSNLSQLLPRVYVGRSGEDLKRIVRVMCDAAKRSLKSKDLALPPWRKNRYMVNKWFGPYKRTVNPVSAAAVGSDNGVKCRCVGFDNAISGRVFVRTR